MPYSEPYKAHKVLQINILVSARTHADRGYLTFAQLFDTVNVFLCRNRKLVKIFYIADVLCPAVHLFVDGLAFGEFFQCGRKISNDLSVFLVSYANFNFAYSAEGVNLI